MVLKRFLDDYQIRYSFQVVFKFFNGVNYPNFVIHSTQLLFTWWPSLIWFTNNNQLVEKYTVNFNLKYFDEKSNNSLKLNLIHYRKSFASKQIRENIKAFAWKIILFTSIVKKITFCTNTENKQRPDRIIAWHFRRP